MLTRKVNETIKVGANVTIHIVRIGPNAVRIGIEAPREMNIMRGELPVEGAAQTEADNDV